MEPPVDFYATLGLSRDAAPEQVRAAYRLLAKRSHPDLHPDDPEAQERARALNEAYETLSDPARRRAYDRELRAEERKREPSREGTAKRHLKHEVHLRLEELLRGTTLRVQVRDPANPEGPEEFALTVPPETPPGTSFRLPREGAFAGGHVLVRVKLQPSARFRARGSDLRTELRLRPERAAQGGSESLPGPRGGMLRLQVPARIGRGEIIRLPGEGLPKGNGGRGDLLVRVTYRPEVRVTRGGR